MGVIFEHKGFRFSSASVYPRVYFYQRRLESVYPRFCNIVERLPKCKNIKQQLHYIHQATKDLLRPPEIVVYGHPNLPAKRVVQCMEALADHSPRQAGVFSSKTLSPSVCYIRTADVDILGQMTVDAFLEELVKMVQELDNGPKKIFVLVEVDKQQSERSINAFRLYINGRIAQILKDMKDVDVIMANKDGEILGNKIAFYMEGSVVEMLEFLRSFLDMFVRKGSSSADTDTPVLITRRALRSILCNQRILADCARQQLFDGVNTYLNDEKTDVFISSLLATVTRKVKCELTEFFSKTHRMFEWIVNDKMEKDDFERQLTEVISPATNKALRELVTSWSLKTSRGTYEPSFGDPYSRRRHDKLALVVANDMDGVIRAMEKRLISWKAHCTSAEKMQFEIKGYIQITITKPVERDRPLVIPENLKHDLTNIKDVFGFGIISDKFEIHVTSERKDVVNSLHELIRKHQFNQEYNIKAVAEGPKNLADLQFETGTEIKSVHAGTLGAFLQDPEGGLYATTCGHVVNGGQPNEVKIRDKYNKFVRFGESKPEWTLITGNPFDTLIDFAAVKVSSEMVNRCIPLLRDEDGIPRKAVVEEGQPGSSQFNGRNVYKFGAASGRTYAILSGSEYTIRQNEHFETGSIIYLEDLPGSVEEEFAKEGDSGALVCYQDPYGVNVNLVSVILGGGMKITGEDETKYMSCLFHKSVLALGNNSKTEFRIHQQAVAPGLSRDQSQPSVLYQRRTV